MRLSTMISQKQYISNGRVQRHGTIKLKVTPKGIKVWEGICLPYQFMIEGENTQKLMEVYNYEWTEEEL